MNSGVDQYGVFGHPISHSLSPFIHGLFARETGELMSYRPFDVRPEDFRARVQQFFAEGGKGLNITLPHKMAAVDVAHQLTARAAHAAAVNTLALQGEEILGDNTDGAGLVRDLCNNLGLVITHRRLLVIGAGGATRGVLAPLLGLEPTVVVIANRSPERAEALATAFSDLGTTQGAGFDQIEPVALRSHHQRHLSEPLGRDPPAARRRHWPADGLLRPRLRALGHRVRTLGAAAGLCARHPGAGNAGGAGSRVVSAVARRAAVDDARHGCAARARRRCLRLKSPQRMVTNSSALVG